jgi:hypothetical protein
VHPANPAILVTLALREIPVLAVRPVTHQLAYVEHSPVGPAVVAVQAARKAMAVAEAAVVPAPPHAVVSAAAAAVVFPAALRVTPTVVVGLVYAILGAE